MVPPACTVTVTPELIVTKTPELTVQVSPAAMVSFELIVVSVVNIIDVA